MSQSVVKLAGICLPLLAVFNKWKRGGCEAEVVQSGGALDALISPVKLWKIKPITE